MVTRTLRVLNRWNLPSLSDFVRQENANSSNVRKVDLMSAIYPLSVHRRIERQWAERINSLRRTRGQVVVGTKRTPQRVSNNDGAVVAVPVSTDVDPRPLGQARPHD